MTKSVVGGGDKDHKHNDNDNDNDDREVDALLSKELLKLSFYDRSMIEEEIHGVRCMAPNETPELLSTALKEFQYELNNQLNSNDNNEEEHDLSKMKAYKYIMMYRENQNQKNEDVSSSNSSASCSASASSSSACALYASYIDTIEFRLRFIRCELFNIKLSVQRFFCYLNFIHDTWGNDVLLKNSLITVKDLTKVESKLLSMGLLQVLPYRDRSGRRVITITGHGIVHDVDPVVLFKLVFFLYDCVTRDSAESQRNGVILIWFGSSSSTSKLGNLISVIKTIFKKVQAASPTRIVCVHACGPNSQFLRVFAKIFMIRATTSSTKEGSYSSMKIHKVKFHFGENMEVQYVLKGYGIPVELLPMTGSGKIKLSYHKQWLKTISLIAQQQVQQQQQDQYGGECARMFASSTTPTPTATILTARVIVECPCFNDVVFRVGKTSTENPGNVTFRNMVLDYLEKEEVACGGISSDTRNKPSKKDHILNDDQNNKTNLKFLDWIMNEITNENGRNGRFLEWDDTIKCWIIMNDMNQIQQKVMMTLYSWRKRRKNAKASASKRNNNNNNNNNNKKKQRVGVVPATTLSTTNNVNEIASVIQNNIDYDNNNIAMSAMEISARPTMIDNSDDEPIKLEKMYNGISSDDDDDDKFDTKGSSVASSDMSFSFIDGGKPASLRKQRRCCDNNDNSTNRNRSKQHKDIDIHDMNSDIHEDIRTDFDSFCLSWAF